nr:hypothetical protein [Anaerolineae bacterium]
MLEKVNLNQVLSKKDYLDRMPALRSRLGVLQQACPLTGTAVITVLEGWDASGRGTLLPALASCFNPSYLSIYTDRTLYPPEQVSPWMRRYWEHIPHYGHHTIFDGSWYARVLGERVEGIISQRNWRTAYRDIIDFERILTDDGIVLVKVFLHISRKEQKRRFKMIEADPEQAWRIQSADRRRQKGYDQYLLAIEEMLERTYTEWCPWHIIPATSLRYAHIQMFETLIARIEAALGDQAPEPDLRQPTAPYDAAVRRALESAGEEL